MALLDGLKPDGVAKHLNVFVADRNASLIIYEQGAVERNLEEMLSKNRSLKFITINFPGAYSASRIEECLEMNLRFKRLTTNGQAFQCSALQKNVSILNERHVISMPGSLADIVQFCAHVCIYLHTKA